MTRRTMLSRAAFPAVVSVVAAALAAAHWTAAASGVPKSRAAVAPTAPPPPLRFIPNHGQWPAPVLYRADTPSGALFLTADGIVAVHPAADGSVAEIRRTYTDAVARANAEGQEIRFDDDVELRVVARDAASSRSAGERPAADRSAPTSPWLVPGTRLAGVTHYLRGADRSAWVADVPVFSSVTVRDARPGVDVRIAAVARAGHGAEGQRLGKGEGERLSEDNGYGDSNSNSNSDVGDDVGVGGDGPHSLRAAAATTPTLAYSTYLGGRLNELARGIAVDKDGSAYIVGTTTSIDFPSVGAGGGPGAPGGSAPLQPGIGNSGSLQDAFVTKLDPTGTRIVWSTYLGGIRQDEAFGVAVDALGRAVVTGYTTSPDFPTLRAVQPALHLAEGIFSGDAFMVRLTPDGGALDVGTFLGGTSRDVGKGVALGPDGAIYLTGWTGSNFPAVNAVYPLNRGVRDAFIAKFTPSGDQLVYTTHLGGSFADEARAIAVDASGRATIVGTTESLNLRVLAPFQRTIGGATDAFVARLNAHGTAFDYATYLGGRGIDNGIAVAVDAAGRATVLGRTESPDFPRADPIQPTRSGPADLFVSRLSEDGAALVYSTYLGGSADEGGCVQDENFRDLGTPTPDGRGIRYLEGSKFSDGPAGALALDADGRAVIASCTASGNLPLVDPLQTRRTGDYALLLAVLAPDGHALHWSSYLGGRGLDVARAAAIGPDGGIFVAGQTDAVDWPLAPAGRALQAQRDGTDDAFALKIGAVAAAWPATPAPPTEAPTIAPSATATTPASATPAPSTSTPTAPVEATPTPDAPGATATAIATADGSSWTVYLPSADVP